MKNDASPGMHHLRCITCCASPAVHHLRCITFGDVSLIDPPSSYLTSLIHIIFKYMSFCLCLSFFFVYIYHISIARYSKIFLKVLSLSLSLLVSLSFLLRGRQWIIRVMSVQNILFFDLCMLCLPILTTPTYWPLPLAVPVGRTAHGQLPETTRDHP